MSDHFDPYYTWLGIPSEEQPADFYRLLGVRQFEANEEVIVNASDQRMAYLRTFQVGKRLKESQELLNEISEAQGCLLDPRKKQVYDVELRRRNAASRAKAISSPAEPNAPRAAPQTAAPRTAAAQLAIARAALAPALPRAAPLATASLASAAGAPSPATLPAAKPQPNPPELGSLATISIAAKPLHPAVAPKSRLSAPLLIGGGFLAAGLAVLVAIAVWAISRPPGQPRVAHSPPSNPASRPASEDRRLPAPMSAVTVASPAGPAAAPESQPQTAAALPVVNPETSTQRAVTPPAAPSSPATDSSEPISSSRGPSSGAQGASPPGGRSATDAVVLRVDKLAISGGGSDLIEGWEFKSDRSVWVTQLGIYDHAGDGLSLPHEVAIWNVREESKPVVQATIPAGKAAPLAGTFRFVPVQPVQLESGESYAIVAHYSETNDNNVDLSNPQGLTVEFAPQLIVAGRRYSFPHRAMAFPSMFSTDVKSATFGPTFRFDLAR